MTAKRIVSVVVGVIVIAIVFFTLSLVKDIVVGSLKEEAEGVVVDPPTKTPEHLALEMELQQLQQLQKEEKELREKELREKEILGIKTQFSQFQRAETTTEPEFHKRDSELGYEEVNHPKFGVVLKPPVPVVLPPLLEGTGAAPSDYEIPAELRAAGYRWERCWLTNAAERAGVKVPNAWGLVK